MSVSDIVKNIAIGALIPGSIAWKASQSEQSACYKCDSEAAKENGLAQDLISLVLKDGLAGYFIIYGVGISEATGMDIFSNKYSEYANTYTGIAALAAIAAGRAVLYHHYSKKSRQNILNKESTE